MLQPLHANYVCPPARFTISALKNKVLWLIWAPELELLAAASAFVPH
jgi:hypothetical protein